jgi:hypothetical protein
MLPPGFMNSSFAITSTSGCGNSRFNVIIGVLPTHASTESCRPSMVVSATVMQPPLTVAGCKHRDTKRNSSDSLILQPHGVISVNVDGGQPGVRRRL